MQPHSVPLFLSLKFRFIANSQGTNEETHGESLQLDAFRKKAQLLSEVESIKRQMHESQLTSFQNEAKCRVAVLRKLGHVDGAGIVTLKVTSNRMGDECHADSSYTGELFISMF